jgi:hypothetical protein
MTPEKLAELDATASERVAADVLPAPTDNEAHQAAAALVEKYGPVRAKLIDTLYRSHTLQEDKVTLDIFIKALDQFELDLSHAQYSGLPPYDPQPASVSDVTVEPVQLGEQTPAVQDNPETSQENHNG